MSTKWIFDALLKQGGTDILHPTSVSSMYAWGFDKNDLDNVWKRVQCGGQMVKAYSMVGAEVEQRAKKAEEMGLNDLACDLYGRAMLLYNRAMYSFFKDDPRKSLFFRDMYRCFDKIKTLGSVTMDRVEIPFEDQKAYANFYYGGSGEKQPCIIFLPGMDMTRLDPHFLAFRYFMPRGFCMAAVDMPGQGEALYRGYKTSLTSPEKALSALIDYLETRPEVDAEKIVLIGISMGSYWGSRFAAFDKRLKATATAMSNYGSKQVIFNEAQPSYRTNFKYMAGITDDAEFDKLAKDMELADLVDQITCPMLVITGEYDELSPLEDTTAFYESLKCPKEFWIMEDAFHPLGNFAQEFTSGAVDWLKNALDGKYAEGYQQGVYWKTNGEVVIGDATPAWFRKNEWD